ncbi:hypothetical protein BCR33DRAFT_303393 [Rhizoclosmatium globosum]|uniref:Uncharacterized protein n=1 Tax=Rhizoclosmatium globosum TaxID=329046 RepID=A0A1Y2A5V6_9FUNG|nr:hypothetical protein BCR33DRAFT_303393 [Rhizoclosmatium globosum]|eukprot:ORY17720.1 hypothetical protein BCR33DRAFT_303393 [Rhizoclosmatium globosum]
MSNLPFAFKYHRFDILIASSLFPLCLICFVNVLFFELTYGKANIHPIIWVIKHFIFPT